MKYAFVSILAIPQVWLGDGRMFGQEKCQTDAYMFSLNEEKHAADKDQKKYYS